MNNKEKYGLEFEAFLILLSILIIVLGLTLVNLRAMDKRLEELERGTAERISEQQSQLDNLSLLVGGVKTEMKAEFAEQQKQIDSQQEQINQAKNVQSNTISALTRLRKNTEKETADIREELKKD